MCLSLPPLRAAELPNWMTGVNLADGGFHSKGTRLHFDYTYPTAAQVDHFTKKGFRVFRVPVLSRRILSETPGAKDPPDWALVTGVIARAAAAGAFVILDLHQYGTMPSGLVGRDAVATAAFVRFWSVVAERLKGSPNIIFGLMNEPNKQNAAEWLDAANAAIAAIRDAGAKQLILVPGTHWDGAWTWTRTDNADVMDGVRDPANNYAIEVHQYLDKDSSGTSPAVVPGSGATRLEAFTQWARAHKVRGFLGEFGFATTPEALKEGGDMLAHMAANKDVWRGWTYWAAGQWWGNYAFSVEPSKTGEDKPQTAVLENYR